MSIKAKQTRRNLKVAWLFDGSLVVGDLQADGSMKDVYRCVWQTESRVTHLDLRPPLLPVSSVRLAHLKAQAIMAVQDPPEEAVTRYLELASGIAVVPGPLREN